MQAISDIFHQEFAKLVMASSKSQCMKYCPKGEINHFGFCVACSDSSCPRFESTAFALTRLDDLNYLYAPSRPLLQSSYLLDSLTVRIQDLKALDDFKYLLVANPNNSIKIRLEFMTSFSDKVLKVEQRLFSRSSAGRLLQASSAATRSPLVIDAFLNQPSSFSAEVKIASVDITNLSLDPAQNDSPFRLVQAPVFLSTFFEWFLPLLLALLGLSLFTLVVSNFSVIGHELTMSLKLWYMGLFRRVILFASLALVNVRFPESLEYFFIMLYSAILGRDDFAIDPLNSFNYTVNQPQFYRLLRTDSLFGNSPVTLSLHLTSLILLLIFSFLRSKPRFKRLSSAFFRFFSANIVNALLFPFYLDVLVNALISLYHSQLTSSAGLLDFLLSLFYFLSFFLSSANQSPPSSSSSRAKSTPRPRRPSARPSSSTSTLCARHRPRRSSSRCSSYSTSSSSASWRWAWTSTTPRPSPSCPASPSLFFSPFSGDPSSAPASTTCASLSSASRSWPCCSSWWSWPTRALSTAN